MCVSFKYRRSARERRGVQVRGWVGGGLGDRNRVKFGRKTWQIDS